MRRPGPTGSAPRRAALAAVLAVPLLVVAACGGSTPPPPTVKVDRGEVTSGVSASGTLVSVKQQNLGFADRGQVAELMVKVGDVVQAGQPLARLDDAAAKSTLASAQAKLDQQNASLGKTPVATPSRRRRLTSTRPTRSSRPRAATSTP
ncbi:biotin/lipoyl-binding protein [Pseudonocardia sp. ICBG601]|uniref:biotin/lipoyl-binding protein n=1 Tax=Pseudonocardia sp. ICBG601 TaxID=2846759 RepID=UPI001CF6D5A2|nr:biotin/lipoyl-binding protein [Pseudonocardia sp. ICBG601]